MNCPICQNNLGLDLPDIEEFYYDCSVCHSSLFFNQGKCEVISRGEWPAEPGAGDDKISGQKDAAGLRDEPHDINEGALEDALQKIQQKSSDQNFSQAAAQSQMLEEKIDRPPSQAVGGGAGSAPSQAMEEKVGLPETSAQESTPFPAVDKKSDSFESEDLIQDNEAEEVPDIEDSPDGLEYPEEEKELEHNESSFVFSEEQNGEENIKEDFSEVLEFSKRRDQDEKGLYLYQLSLSEINSQPLKETVSSVLEDKALGIDFEENSSYKKNIVYNGKVVLSRLSPVQVYVIIQSLMGLPLKIHWEQSHIVDS